MNKIRYEFCDGTVSEVEVSDEVYAVHEQLTQDEKCNHKRETRRHLSLDALSDNGIDFEDSAGDCLAELINQEDDARLSEALAILSDKQRILVEKVFWNNMTLREIAKEMNMSHQALSQQLATVFKKLKILL